MVMLLANIYPLLLTGQQNKGGSPLASILMLGGMLVILYFFLIRPQKKRQKQVDKMLSELSVGNKVVTIGGFVGKIKKLDSDDVYLTFGDSEKPMIVKKWAVKNVVTE